MQLRAGCITLGIIAIITNSLNLLANILLFFIEFEDLGGISDESQLPSLEPDLQQDEEYVHIDFTAIDMIMSLIHIIIYSLLVHGVRNINYKLIHPTLIWIPISFAIDVVIFVISVVYNVDEVEVISVVLVLSVPLVLNLFCWLAVFSLWREGRVQVGAPQRLTSQHSVELGKE